MVIKDLGIANYRSFDSDGVLIEDLGRVNIFIGKNNSGKSNVLKFLRELSSWVTYIENFYPFEKQFMKKYFSEIENYHNKEQKYTPVVTVKTEDGAKTVDFKDIAKFSQENKGLGEIWRRYFKDTIYLPAFRQVQEVDSKEYRDYRYIDGINMISKLSDMQHPESGKEKDREIFNKIQDFIKYLLNIKDLRIEIPNSNTDIVLNINGQRLNLKSFGTGIHELVILCSAIAIHPDYVFCIEEPEIHLHPELQRKFLEFLENNLQNMCFITTHSNVFLDYSPDRNIYHVTHNGSKTNIEKVNTNKESYQILDDLGYKASDILQSNGIIWLEGPSDKIYLEKWMKLFTEENIDFAEYKFNQGIHYTFMYYGGRLLSHLTAKNSNLEDLKNDNIDDEIKEEICDDLINLLYINRNSIVMIDRDIDSSDKDILGFKQRLKDGLEENCWITDGREIENYLSEVTINDFLEDKKYDRHFKYDKYKRFEDNFTLYKINEKSIENLDKLKSFTAKKITVLKKLDDKYLKRELIKKINELNEELAENEKFNDEDIEDIINNASRELVYKKVNYAKKISPFIKKEDFEIETDLKERIAFLFKSIAKWNQIEIRKADNS